MALIENSGKKTAAARSLPPAAQNEDGARVAHISNGLAVVGLAVAGGAATELATGMAAPVTSFTMFLMLLGGLSVVTIHVAQNAGGPDPAAEDDASFTQRMRVGLPVVGLAVAGVAATELATGVAAPVTSFTMFLMLLCGLSLVTIHVAQNAIGAVRVDETDAAYLFSAARRNWNAALSLFSGPRVAWEKGLFSGARDAHYGYGLPSVAKDENAGGPDPAAVIGRGNDDASFTQRMRVGLPVVGLAVAGVAATELATGVAAPVTGFTMFLMLLGGLSLVTIHVLRA